MAVIITNLANPAQAALFDKAFALYEHMFPAHERHGYETLVAGLNRNTTRSDVQTLWLVETGDDGVVLGALAAYLAPGGEDADRLVTMAYMFVSPLARGKGLARQLERDLIAHVNAKRILIVCDIEDPSKMIIAGVTKAEYDEAVALYDITPFERLVFWRDRMGYRGTDFPYTLLVNRPGAEPTSVLSLHVRLIDNGADRVPEKVSAITLREAAAFINCECPYADIPASHRDHPALAAMWSWPDSNTHARVSPGLASEFDSIKDHWK